MHSLKNSVHATRCNFLILQLCCLGLYLQYYFVTMLRLWAAKVRWYVRTGLMRKVRASWWYWFRRHLCKTIHRCLWNNVKGLVSAHTFWIFRTKILTYGTFLIDIVFTPQTDIYIAIQFRKISWYLVRISSGFTLKTDETQSWAAVTGLAAYSSVSPSSRPPPDRKARS